MLFAFLLAAAAAQAAAPAPAPPAPPISVVSVVNLGETHPAIPLAVGSWFGGDAYPAEAVKKGIEGSVRFEVNVDATGKPTACRIVKSSNSDLLDEATCRIVMAKGKFIPAASNGKPVASTFQTNTAWRLAGPAAPPNGYVAAILDFSKDPNHPSCSLIVKGIVDPPSCEEAVQTYGPGGARARLKQVVALTSLTTGNAQPYRGEAAWGRRMGYIAIDLYPPKDAKPGAMPACVIVAEDGPGPDMDPCAPYGGVSSVSNAEKNSPDKAHIEKSIFGIPESSPTRSGKCKDGESSAESVGCG